MTEWQDGDKSRIRNYLQLPPEAIATIQQRMDWLLDFDTSSKTDIVGEVQSALDELDAIAAGLDTLTGNDEITSESMSVQGEYSRSVTYSAKSSASSRTNRQQQDLINKIARDLGLMQQLNISTLYRS